MDQTSTTPLDFSSSTAKCPQCGSDLEYAPGTKTLICRSCNSTVAIDQIASEQTELDFTAYLRQARDAASTSQTATMTCPACSAVSTVTENTRSTSCPFCGSELKIVGKSQVIAPAALLPFKIDEKKARFQFASWTKKLWFAPSDFKKAAYINDKFHGVYLPYWTYDCFAATPYQGQRGTFYYETESYTTTVNGRQERRTRQVRKTRWNFTSGTVHNQFNDVLVPASHSLPQQHLNALEPWDLGNLVKFDENFLSGFRAECYSVDLEPGFKDACVKMDPEIIRTIREDIGGDEQRVTSMSPSYSLITFKHVLLPIWISSCRYRGKVYRFLVNARTGEVQGDRPWSHLKIALAAIAAIIVLGVSAYIIAQKR